MIEIIMIIGGERVSVAEADDPESAVVAGRTLWDDNMNQGWYGCSRRLIFRVDGETIRTFTQCP
jgi:hypothetical protein